MTNRRRVGAAFVAVGATLLVLALSTSPVHAEAPTQTGWWFELQTKSLPAPLPNPPVVPDGGLYVQQGPNGPTAYGAVHYPARDAAGATLTLITAPGSTARLSAPVQACATSGPWTAPNPSPGAWEDAPKYGDPCTPGKIAADGSAVAFFFNGPFFKSSGLDVAIVPIEGAAPFTLAFEKPAADSLSVTPKAEPLTKTSTPTTFASNKATGGASGTTSGNAAAPSAKPAAPATPAAPAAPATDNNRSTLATNVLNAAGLGDPDRGERAVALAGASAIVVGWWLLSTRAVPMPRLLGALGGGRVAAAGADGDPPAPPTHVGGVGRFAKTRTTNARRIR